MKRFLACVVISALGVLTIGCDSQKGTTENKTVTTTRRPRTARQRARQRPDRHQDEEHYSRRWRHGDRKDDREDHRNDQVVLVRGNAERCCHSGYGSSARDR